VLAAALTLAASVLGAKHLISTKARIHACVVSTFVRAAKRTSAVPQHVQYYFVRPLTYAACVFLAEGNLARVQLGELAIDCHALVSMARMRLLWKYLHCVDLLA
jgi:methionine-rich copper-binding protein CopC